MHTHWFSPTKYDDSLPSPLLTPTPTTLLHTHVQGVRVIGSVIVIVIVVHKHCHNLNSRHLSN